MSFLSSYKNLQKIGSSNNSVIYNADNKEALKILLHPQEAPQKHSPQCSHLHNEYKLLKKFNHKNIIKPKQYSQHQSHKSQQFCCLNLELADLDFFGLIEQTFPKKVEIPVLKDLLKQICQGLEYLHNTQNVTHNDIKLENILLFLNQDKQGNVTAVPKIADFGFAKNQNQQEENIDALYQRWNNRSNCSLAPEILRFKKYYRDQNMLKARHFDEMKAEMFSLGVLIFSAFFLRSPIASETAHTEDKYYKYFYHKDFQQFWALKDFQYELNRISSDKDSDIENLKDLIQKLLAVDPRERPSIKQVLNHKWFQN